MINLKPASKGLIYFRIWEKIT